MKEEEKNLKKANVRVTKLKKRRKEKWENKKREVRVEASFLVFCF